MQKARAKIEFKWLLQDAVHVLSGAVNVGWQRQAHQIITTMTRDRPGGHEGSALLDGWNTPIGRKVSKKHASKRNRWSGKKYTREVIRDMLDQHEKMLEQDDWYADDSDDYLYDPEDDWGFGYGFSPLDQALNTILVEYEDGIISRGQARRKIKELF